jgi:hypothetical protein
MGMRHIVSLFLTSKDADEIAAELRKKELNNRIGQDLTARRWYLNNGDVVEFIVDQTRADKQGLMGKNDVD